MSIRMKALKSFPYAGRRIAQGEVFFARGRSDAKVLFAIRSAIEYPEINAQPHAKPYQTRAMTAENPKPSYTHTPTDSGQTIFFEGRRFDLDQMTRSDLFDLATQMGIKVHHLSGAQKIRQALLQK